MSYIEKTATKFKGAKSIGDIKGLLKDLPSQGPLISLFFFHYHKDVHGSCLFLLNKSRAQFVGQARLG